MSESPASAAERLLHIVRFTLEAVSLLSTSGLDGEGDAPILRDANGLPTIAGTSPAGVMRHLLATSDADLAKKLFGWQGRTHADGRAARLAFSFGLVHDAHGRAVSGLLGPQAIAGDAILRHLALDMPLKRDHVALDVRGVADDKTKFDRTAVPRGTRFSFEITMWGSKAARKVDTDILAMLLGLIEDPQFRIGGASRRGYGQVRLVQDALHRAIDAHDAIELRNARAAGFHQLPGGRKLAPAAARPARKAVQAELRLRPLAAWRIGGGSVGMSIGAAKVADAKPLSEAWIDWPQGNGASARLVVPTPPAKGTDRRKITVPASAIKGALKHRTAFHLRG